ncbi:MAG: hypothetical protein ACXAEJ_14055 [Candidatus Thorarchaeota archaeon]|jgi:predicted acyl esterase
MKANFSLPIVMQDGMKLSTILFTPVKAGTFTTVLIRTPYSAKGYLAAVDALRNVGSYAIVLQDTRSTPYPGSSNRVGAMVELL